MDRNSIKKDGILEQYLLGELSAQDVRKVEAMLQQDEALRNDFRALEEDFERLAFENAIDPRPEVKTSLMKKVEASDFQTAEAQVKTLPRKNRTSFYFPVAASIAALLLLGSVWLYTNWQRANQDVETLQNQTTDLQQRIERLEDDLKQTQEVNLTLNSPDVAKLILKGNTVSPNSVAVAYVDHKNKKVHLNPEGLAALDEDHDYQLWADVEGEMINMGVIPEEGTMVAMTYIDHAESLNITIEPAGGNDHPTVERLISNTVL